MRATRRITVVLALLAVSSGRATSQVSLRPSLDSIVLVSTGEGFSATMSQHVTLTRAGVVDYAAWIDHELATSKHVTIPVRDWSELEARAARTRLETYPDIVEFDAWLCEDQREPVLTVRLVLYWPGGRKTVVDNHACRATKGGTARARLVALRQLEEAVEATAGTAPWLAEAMAAHNQPRSAAGKAARP